LQRREADGEPYWDGGFSANPALWPLLRVDRRRPAGRDVDPWSLVTRRPRSTNQAAHAEIAFNAAFLREMQLLATPPRRRAARGGVAAQRCLRRTRCDRRRRAWPTCRSSARRRHPQWLQQLRMPGGASPDVAEGHGHPLGARSSIDLVQLFGQRPAATADTAPVSLH
jgi:NTE family protein